MAYDTLTPEGYLPRIADAQIERYLRVFGAVEVAGPKWCGKTWSALAHGSSVVYVDEGSNTPLARADPSLMLEDKRPHVIDEWQRAPNIWNAVRHEVDARRGYVAHIYSPALRRRWLRRRSKRTLRRATAELVG